MSASAIEPDHNDAGVFAQLSDTTALFMVGEDSLGPDTCPDLLPAGWTWSGEIADFEFQNGDWREVYILERDE